MARRRPRIALRCLLAPLLAALLVACGAAPSPGVPTPAPTPPGPTAVPVVTASPPPFDCGTAIARPGTAPRAEIVGLEVVNDGATGRIAFTFAPRGSIAVVPEVAISPAAPPFARDPSGLPLEVPGDAFLSIVLRGGTTLDEDYRPTFDGPFDVDPAGSPIVAFRRAGDFEAVSSWVVGLTGPSCARILPPDGSGRLVIEVRRA